MKGRKWCCVKNGQRRASVIVWTAISSTVLLGFTALAVDFGYVKVVKAQLQSAADASAMAGASGLFNIAERVGPMTQEELAGIAKSRAVDYCAKNFADGKSLQIAPSDITVGTLTRLSNLSESMTFGTDPYNSVCVVVEKTNTSVNGPVSLFFAPVFGKNTSSVVATATAAIDDRMIGYKTRKTGSVVIPVTVKVEKWTNDIINRLGDDCFGYDPDTGQITEGPDGVPEISIFPEKQKLDETSDGAGNFGLLNFGNNNSGVPPLAEQIRNGLNDTAFRSVFGSDEARFVDANGQAVTYGCDGTTGVKNTLMQCHDAFSSRMGEIIGFFIHIQVQESGTNAIFTLSTIQFGRLVYLNPHASLNQKSVVIQPVAYTGDEIITGEVGPHHVTGGRIVLVR